MDAHIVSIAGGRAKSVSSEEHRRKPSKLQASQALQFCEFCISLCCLPLFGRIDCCGVWSWTRIFLNFFFFLLRFLFLRILFCIVRSLGVRAVSVLFSVFFLACGVVLHYGDLVYHLRGGYRLVCGRVRAGRSEDGGKGECGCGSYVRRCFPSVIQLLQQ